MKEPGKVQTPSPRAPLVFGRKGKKLKNEQVYHVIRPDLYKGKLRLIGQMLGPKAAREHFLVCAQENKSCLVVCGPANNLNSIAASWNVVGMNNCKTIKCD